MSEQRKIPHADRCTEDKNVQQVHISDAQDDRSEQPGDRKRQRKETLTERLSLGTFAAGTSIYRNRLHPGELFQNGHVGIADLVLPECDSAVCATFEGPGMPWLHDILQGVRDVLLIQHCEKHVVGAGKLEPISETNSNWLGLGVKPHTGGCLHAKFLLFRSSAGLRVVVCGSNLFQSQWETDRDTLWVQDFFESSGCCMERDDEDDASSVASSKSSIANRNGFSHRLRYFLDDLTQCHCLVDTRRTQARLEDLFYRIDFTTAAARFVFSFPRPNGSSKREQGGWHQLGETVHSLLDEFDEETGTIIYAMTGSFGNVDPDFLLQMHRAMHGRTDGGSASKNSTWKDVKGIRCLWPSPQTARDMNFGSFVGSGRAIPLSYWNSIPEEAKRRVFFDAPPNPQELGLPHLQCHPFSHAKAMFRAGGRNAVVYVGSHNFSKAAWGLRQIMPKNVEAGIVLVSSVMEKEWRDRLPCRLPTLQQSPTSYFPVTASNKIREMCKSGDAREAYRLFQAYLRDHDGNARVYFSDSD